MSETMQALRITKHGPHTALSATDVPDPTPGVGEVRVAIEAAGINPSDVGSAEGRFANAPLPRILGRDFAGRVVEGPKELVGTDVWGSGGDLGITRDGTHAESLIVPQEAVATRPKILSVEEAASAGVPFVTAWAALVDAGRLQSGEWVVISGAAGAVGGAAIEIAAARGAHVIALVLNADEAARLDRTKVQAVSQSDRNDLVDVVRSATTGRGAELALNGVGSVIFQPMLDSLSDGGRLVVYSAAAGRDVTVDLFDLYRRRLQLVGVNTGVIDAARGARILRELTPLFESGALRPPRIAARYPLSQAASAYAAVAHGAPGKVVLIPDRQYQSS